MNMIICNKLSLISAETPLCHKSRAIDSSKANHIYQKNIFKEVLKVAPTAENYGKIFLPFFLSLEQEQVEKLKKTRV